MCVKPRASPGFIQCWPVVKIFVRLYLKGFVRTMVKNWKGLSRA